MLEAIHLFTENFLFCFLISILVLLLFLGFHKSSDQLGMVYGKVLLETQDHVQPATFDVPVPVAGHSGTSLRCSNLHTYSANRGLSLEPSTGSFADLCPLDTLASCASGLPLVTSVALVPCSAFSVCNSALQPKLTCTSEPACFPDSTKTVAVSQSTSRSPGAKGVISGPAIPESSRPNLKRCADENKSKFDMHFKKKLLHAEHQIDLQRLSDSRSQMEVTGAASSTARSSIIGSSQPNSICLADNKTVSSGATATSGILRYTLSNGTSQPASSNSGQVLRAAMLGGKAEGNVRLQSAGSGILSGCRPATTNLHPAPTSAVPIFIHHANGQPPSIRTSSQSFSTPAVLHSSKFQVNRQPPASQTVPHSQSVQFSVQPPTVQLGTMPISSSARPVIFCSLPQNLSVNNSGCSSQNVFPNLMSLPLGRNSIVVGCSDPAAGVSQAGVCNAVPFMSGESNSLGHASQQLLKAHLQRDAAPQRATRYVFRLATSLSPMLCPSTRLLATPAISFARPATYGPTASLGSAIQNFTGILLQGSSANQTLGSSMLGRVPSDSGSFSSGIGTAASSSPDLSSQDEQKSPSPQDC